MALQILPRLREANSITGANKFLRRYFVMNGFDGALTTLGIVFGMFIAGVQQPKVALFAAAGGAIALAVSGTWGTYLTEKSERRKELLMLENQMLTEMHGTVVSRAADLVAVESALANGVSPLLMAVVIAMPFAAAQAALVGMQAAYLASFAAATALLFLLGAYLGKISRQNIVLMGGKMVAAGVFSVAIAFLFTML